MNFHLPRLAILFAIASAALTSFAQTPGLSWVGEWGTFHRVPQMGQRSARDEGYGLSINACTATHCNFSFLVESRTGHGSATGDLQITSDTQAVARLLASTGGQEKCSLTLEKTNGSNSSIRVHQRAGDCSYFLTPGASFAHDYPLRSRTRFYGKLFIPDCFIGDARSQMALCASENLAQQEYDWIALLWGVSDLGPKLDMEKERTKLLKACDAASDPGACLGDAFRKSTQELNARKTAWKAEVTEPGDPREAERAIAKLVGTYRHTFENGDVDGDKFQSTDTLEITRASEASIHYEVQLQFFNGHECGREGVASYRRNGMFVDQVADDEGKLCAFEVKPTEKGVQLLDPTGVCRMTDCGARGGYGAEFTFAERKQLPALPSK